MPELHEYTGTVSKFIFQAEDFAIFKFKTSSGDFTALGDIFEVNEGEKLFIKGSWEKHPKYGKQLRVKTWEKIIPTDRENAIELLSLGIIKGVGPATAENIVNTLGPNAIEIILESPERLTEVKGIGKKKAQKISRSTRASRL